MQWMSSGRSAAVGLVDQLSRARYIGPLSLL
jgi:hypothetical protein